MLTFLALTLLLVACNNQDADNDENVPSSIQVIGASGSVTLAENRVVLTLRDGFEYVSDVKALQIKARDIQQQGDPVAWEGAAVGYTDYEVPYWVFYPELSRAGGWLFDVAIEKNDGKKINATFSVNVFDAPLGLTAGREAFPSETRTASTADELAVISSDATPNLAFYERTVAEAVQSGQPSIIAFTTPGFCVSKLCIPVMDTVDALWESYAERGVQIVHVEVYADFEALNYVPAMAEWELVNEPWIYVVDADGIITARYDGPVSVQEITPAIEDVLNES